jgi:DNA topoisomerase IB
MSDVIALKVAARYQAGSQPFPVTAKYSEKKQVPKANGKGKTTVYVYSEGQVDKRNKEKAKRLQAFKPKVDKLRAKVKTDLKSKDYETRLTALVVALIDETHERIGSPASSKGDLNDDGEPHYGVSQWLKKHVTLSEGKATIRYVGKSGVDQEKEVTTPYVLSALRDAVKAADGKESMLFEGVTGEKVNAYLKEFSVTCKDLRSLGCNSMMQRTLRRIRSKGGKLPEDKKDRAKKLKAEFKEALEEVASEIGGHEPSTLANQYLAPNMEPQYLKDGTVIDKLSD